MYGLSGNELFLATARDRAVVFEAVAEGLRSGTVQPIAGAEVFAPDTRYLCLFFL